MYQAAPNTVDLRARGAKSDSQNADR